MMSMLLALIKKEMLALLRDVHGLAALLLMPVLFIVIMSLALKDVYNPPSQDVALRRGFARCRCLGAQPAGQLGQRATESPNPCRRTGTRRCVTGELKLCDPAGCRHL